MSKVLIDMPTDYRFDTILGAIQNGTSLDGLTNGEVLMKMFPNAKVEGTFKLTETRIMIRLKDEDTHDFDLEWWNRKWGE